MEIESNRGHMLPVACLCGLSCLFAIGALALAPNSPFALPLLSPLFARITQKITRAIQVSTTMTQVDTLSSISTSMLFAHVVARAFQLMVSKRSQLPFTTTRF